LSHAEHVEQAEGEKLAGEWELESGRLDDHVEQVEHVEG